MPDELLTTQQIAERLQVNIETVYGWLNDPKSGLAGYRLPGRGRGTWRVTEESLQQFLERYRNKPGD